MKFFTPGPTQLSPKAHDLILEALKNDIPSISHRSKQFSDIYKRADTALRALMNVPADFGIYFLGSATEAMERIIQNCSAQRTHHFTNGAFSERFFEIANELGRTASQQKADYGKGFDLSTCQLPQDAELICLTQNETSTGVWLPPESIASVRQKSPQAIIAVDIVSSAPVPKLNWTDLDCAFFSVQKCFGLPAGLGVLIANRRSHEKAAALLASKQSTGSYHNFATLENYAKKFQTPATPNVLGIYLLAGAAEHMLQTGIEKIRSETTAKAKLIYDALSKASEMRPFVSEPAYRSPTVVTAIVDKGSAALVSSLAQHGYEIGTGYGSFKDSQIRIANFPMHSLEDIESLIKTLSPFEGATAAVIDEHADLLGRLAK